MNKRIPHFVKGDYKNWLADACTLVSRIKREQMHYSFTNIHVS